jgi:hypothetical protein
MARLLLVLAITSCCSLSAFANANEDTLKRAVDVVLASGIEPGILSAYNADVLKAVTKSPRWCRHLDENGQCAVACTSGDALVAQQGKYWIPCGGVAARPVQNFELPENNRYLSLCRREDLLTSEAECREAAEQFQKEWEAGLESGFATTSKTSNRKFKSPWYTDPNKPGRRPRFFGTKKTSEHMDLYGCYMDVNGNAIWWTEYTQNTPNELILDATYTELGGLIPASFTKSPSVLGLAGICKSGSAPSRIPTTTADDSIYVQGITQGWCLPWNSNGGDLCRPPISAALRATCEHVDENFYDLDDETVAKAKCTADAACTGYTKNLATGTVKLKGSVVISGVHENPTYQCYQKRGRRLSSEHASSDRPVLV